MSAARRVLMVAYHFPPLAGSSGIQRTLRFVQQLPDHGWQPLVLGADPRAFERTADDLDAEVPAGTVVRRAFALDTARHLSIGGRYPGSLARPDRWASWRFDAVRQGLRMIREFSPQAIWSTYPIATAHVIGAALQRASGLPWIADFRDPMAQDGYPEDPKVWASFKSIEEKVARQAARLVFTTPSAARLYRARYPDAAARVDVLENGYDESTFARAEDALGAAGGRVPLNPGRLTLLHSGIVYPSERDPTQLFDALAQLRATSPGIAARLVVRFRAAVAEDLLRGLAASRGVDSMVEVLPAVGYADALAEMLRADALLVMQAANCNEQVPAKVYEYLRAGRPILALTDPAGDTWQVLSGAGLNAVARLDDTGTIARLLSGFVSSAQGVPDGTRPTPHAVAAAAREARSRCLARWLDECAGLGVRAA